MNALSLSSRRTFLQNLGSLSAFAALPAGASAISDRRSEPAFAYVGCPDCIQVNRIRVFTTGHPRWLQTQSIPSRHPSFLALHSNRRLLFATNDVDEHLGLPAGAVESYAIDPASGHLTLINRRTLSLSATRPRQLAVAPDGRHLIVAAYGGGVYNVLPISPGGELGTVTQIFKEIGSGPHAVRQAAAHPHTVALHPEGKFVFSTDLGSDRINVFAADGGELTRISPFELPPGYGPARMVVHPSGSLLFVQSELDALLSCYRFNSATGQIRHLTSRSISQSNALALHPSGHFLYTTGERSSDAITAWKINESTGALMRMESVLTGAAHSLTVSHQGHSLYLLRSRQEGAAARISIDSATGRLGRPVTLARLKSPLSLALL